MGQLQDRIALVTGASRGIGRAVAKRFAQEGAHVVLVARTEGGLVELYDEIITEDGSATIVVADLTNFDLIDQMAVGLGERFGRLDILVANAGMLGPMGPVSHVEPDVWRQVMDLNVTANWRLIRAFEAHLKQSDAGRIILVSSGITAAPRAYLGPYAASKAALESLGGTFAAETVKTSIRVNTIDPGSTRTAMRRAAYPGEDPQTVKPPEDVAETFVDLASPECTRHGDLIRLT